MRYMLAYMLEGDAKEYHLELSNRLARHFRLRPVSSRVDPHITLKAPFDAQEVKEITDAVQFFAEKEASEPLLLGGVSCFPKRIIYMDVHAPKQTHMLVRRLQDKLRNVAWLSFGPKEFPLRLHATLCYAKKEQQTREILSYLKKEKPFEFACKLDHIAFLEKGIRWKEVARYPINK